MDHGDSLKSLLILRRNVNVLANPHMECVMINIE